MEPTGRQVMAAMGFKVGYTKPTLAQFRKCEICGEQFQPIEPGKPIEKRCPLCS